MLHPVVVTPEGRLIAGQRRLEACRSLGWTDIPVTVVDLYQAARGEAHENFVRKDLLPSEIVALKRAIEPLERREARERQGHTATSVIPPLWRKDRGPAGDARDKIARYLGVGRTTIDRAEAVVEAAEEEPEEYGHLVEQMDRSGKVARRFSAASGSEAGQGTGDGSLQLPQRPVPSHRRRSALAVRHRRRPALSHHADRRNQGHARRDIAASDAILWLWTTNAHLRVAFEVVEAWGFEYKIAADVGQRPHGHRRMAAGSDRALPAGGSRQAGFLHGSHTTVLQAARREHSRKPEEFYG